MNKNCEEVLKGNIDFEDTDKKRHRSYVLTSFCEEEPEFCEEVQYLCYSPEICPTTKRKHWQGYIFFKSKDGYSIKKAQKILGGKYTIKPANGTPMQNKIYCGFDNYEKKEADGTIKKKDKNPLFKEFGEFPSQGKRTDLIEIKNEIFKGKKVDDICVEDPLLYHQYGRTLEKLEDIYLMRQFRTEMPETIWYYGKTGVGKSHTAFQGYNPDTHYLLNVKDGGFWDGYVGQKTVIINEFRGEINFQDLLQICDKWPYGCKRKGKAKIPLLANKIIITSCKRPEDIYTNSLDDDDNIDQFVRRCKIIKLHSRGTINL